MVVQRLGLCLILLLFALVGKAQDACPDPEKLGKKFCWKLTFDDNLGDHIHPDEITFWEISIYQNGKEIKGIKTDTLDLIRFSLTEAQLRKGSIDLMGRCSRRLSTSRIQIWKFEQKLIPLNLRYTTVPIRLININCI